MKNGTAAGPSGIFLEKIKAAGEAGDDIITELVNQIIMEGVFPAECKLNIIVKCYKEMDDSLKKGNYRD